MRLWIRAWSLCNELLGNRWFSSSKSPAYTNQYSYSSREIKQKDNQKPFEFLSKDHLALVLKEYKRPNVSSLVMSTSFETNQKLKSVLHVFPSTEPQELEFLIQICVFAVCPAVEKYLKIAPKPLKWSSLKIIGDFLI